MKKWLSRTWRPAEDKDEEIGSFSIRHTYSFRTFRVAELTRLTLIASPNGGRNEILSLPIHPQREAPLFSRLMARVTSRVVWGTNGEYYPPPPPHSASSMHVRKRRCKKVDISSPRPSERARFPAPNVFTPPPDYGRSGGRNNVMQRSRFCRFGLS